MSAAVSRRRALLFVAALGLGLAACERLDAPVDPVWGKEPCGHCAMLVGDRRFAAQIVTEGERKFFDDIGCMVLWTEKHPGKARGAWVRDAGGARWIDAKGARFLPGARTPMDFGFEGHAASVVGPDGRDVTVSWDEMRAATLRRSSAGIERSE